MERVAAVLNLLKVRAAVDAIVLTTEDGLVVDGVAEPDTDIDTIAAYAANYASVSARMGEESRFGPIDSVIVISPGRAMVIAPVDSTVVAAIVGPGGMQVGNMRLQLQRSLKELATALGEEAQASFASLAPGPGASLTEHSNGSAAPKPQDVSVKLS